ncbi:MAG: restriction endonuclease subunit S [Nitrosomonas sp.]|uniref:restriction endonuclease subunit S n=1 Tax=Nitrosomonas sp. TaxID=42353 RepID=UPI0032EF71F2
MKVPKLRFRDDDGREFPEWKEKTLEEIASIERGKFSVRPRNDPRYFGGNIPFAQTGDVVSSDLFLKKFNQTLNEEGLKVSKLFPKNTILITIAANIGNTAITNFEIACTDSIVAIQPFREQAIPVWLKYTLDTKKEELDSKATQNAQKNINLQVLRPLVLVTPSLEEQTKIANFLTAIDEKITQLTQKCDLLAQYKKGVMQQIFSQKLRFKDDDGREFPEWEEATLGDLFNIKAGGDISQENVSQKKDEIYKYPIFANSDKNFGLYGYSNQFKVNSDAITVTGRGNLGIAIPRFEPFYPIVRLLILIPKTKFNIYFGASAINKLDFFVESTGVPQLTAPQLSSFSIKFPIYEEQTKIANFLTAIDDKITQAQAQLEAVKRYKKGLLQQMFV